MHPASAIFDEDLHVYMLHRRRVSYAKVETRARGMSSLVRPGTRPSQPIPTWLLRSRRCPAEKAFALQPHHLQPVSARRVKSAKREIIGGQRPESRRYGGLLNRGPQGGQAGLVPG